MKSGLVALCLALPLVSAAEGIPPVLNYQGSISTDGVPFNSTGTLYLSIINGSGATSPTINYWTNDGSQIAPGQRPANGVRVPVRNGLFNVTLGDSSLPNMTAIPTSVSLHDPLYLRVWFDNGVHGPEWLEPDQRITANVWAWNSERLGGRPAGDFLTSTTLRQYGSAIKVATYTNASGFQVRPPTGFFKNLTFVPDSPENIVLMVSIEATLDTTGARVDPPQSSGGTLRLRYATEDAHGSDYWSILSVALFNRGSAHRSRATLCSASSIDGPGPNNVWLGYGLSGKSSYSFQIDALLVGDSSAYGFDARDVVVKVYYITGGFLPAGSISE